ncbi:MAG: hypothetical protein KTR25_11125 [Myxococcales bacterium]|nr:hypothetical protein [Myxococcales bacterium]
MDMYRISTIVLLGGMAHLSPLLVWAQDCEEGNGVERNLSGTEILNTYYPSPLGDKVVEVKVGQTSVPIDAVDTEGTPVDVGDVVLIIQMQGAAINGEDETQPGGRYGDGEGGLDRQGVLTEDERWLAGQYELNRAAGPVADNAIPLEFPLRNRYESSDAPEGDNISGVGLRRYQVVRVPSYQTLVIPSDAKLTGSAWNGRLGGIVALDVHGKLTIRGSIDATGLGFRGGVNTLPLIEFEGDPHLVSFGRKGEGVVGTPRRTRNLDGSLSTRESPGYYRASSFSETEDLRDLFLADTGLGAPGNAGGAPVHPDAGGAGGGGFGEGGFGGLGNEIILDFYTPSKGGAGLQDPARLFMGGGGSSGHLLTHVEELDDGPISENKLGGYSGGGIVFLRSTMIEGSGSILANGQDGAADLSEGGGGGGGGGQIWLMTNTRELGGLDIQARGGKGGTVSAGQSNGGGGGGGGGLIALVIPEEDEPADIVYSVDGGLGGAGINGEDIPDLIEPPGEDLLSIKGVAGEPGVAGSLMVFAEAPVPGVCELPPEPDPDPSPEPDPGPSPEPDPGPSPEPDPDPSPEPDPDPSPEPGPSPELNASADSNCGSTAPSSIAIWLFLPLLWRWNRRRLVCH